MALWCFSEQSRNNTKIIICATRKASIVRLAGPCELAVQSPGHRTFLYMAVGCLSLIKTKLHILGMQWTSLNCLSVCDKQHLAWSVSIVCTFTLPRKWQSSWALQGVHAIHSPTWASGRDFPLRPAGQRSYWSLLPVSTGLYQSVPCLLALPWWPQTHRGGNTQARGLSLPVADIAVIFNVLIWVDSWFFLLLINVMFID